MFCWHNVEATWFFSQSQPPGVGAPRLRRQLRAVKRAWNVMPLETAVADLAEGRPLPPRAAALSFDDGYRDNLELALPILEELGLHATFFLVPGFLSGTEESWWERLGWAFANAGADRLEWDGQEWPLATAADRDAALDVIAERLKIHSHHQRRMMSAEISKRLQPTMPALLDRLYMDWDGAAELVRRGQGIGSHTMRHAILARETPEAQAEDLAEASALLERRLGVDVSLLAYPNGQAHDFDTATIEATRAAGITAAFTTVPGMSTAAIDPYALPRVVVAPVMTPREYAGTAKGLAKEALRLRIAGREEPRRERVA